LFVARGSCAAAGKEVAVGRCGDQAGKRSDHILGRDPPAKRPALVRRCAQQRRCRPQCTNTTAMIAPTHRQRSRTTQDIRSPVCDRTTSAGTGWAMHASKGLHREDLDGPRPLGEARLFTPAVAMCPLTERRSTHPAL
jgi:hypothetical protein